VEVATPTPLTIPDAKIVTTPELARLINTDPDLLLIDALAGPHDESLPGARRIPFAGLFGSFDDDSQHRLKIRLGNFTAHDRNRTIAIFCNGVDCWESYNACLRAKHAGYRNILWYRGGIAAWREWATSGGDKNLAPQSISQTAKAVAQRLSSPEESAEARWSDAVSLSEAVPVLLDVPDIQGALDAAETARKAFKVLTSTDPGNVDLAADSIANLGYLSAVFEKKNDRQAAIDLYHDADQRWTALLTANPADETLILEESNSLYVIGQSFRKNKHYDDALTSYNKVIEDDKKLLAMSHDSQVYLSKLVNDYLTVADTQDKENKRMDAIRDFENAKSIAARLVDSNPNERSYKFNLCSTEYYLAEVLTKADRLNSSLSNYLECASILKEFADRPYYIYKLYSNTAKTLNELAYNFIIAKDLDSAMTASNAALTMFPSAFSLQASRAYALMFLGKTDEALNIFRQYQGKTGENGWSWNQSVLKDFEDLKKHELSNPLMTEIEKMYAENFAEERIL
jgi:tetratricopeptide (TPR) repeat protein